MQNICIPLKYTVDLDSPVVKQEIIQPFVRGGHDEHRLIVTVMRGKSAVDLSGVSCKVYAVLPDESTAVMDGEVSGNAVTTTLNECCYALHGRISILLRLTIGGEVVSTPLYLTGTVIDGVSDIVIDPGNIVPGLDDLLAMVDKLEQAAADTKQVTGEASAKAKLASEAAAAANEATVAASTAAMAANEAAAAAADAATAASEAATQAGTADRLRTTREIRLNGNAQGSALCDGSADIDIYTETNKLTNEELERMLL